MGLNYIQNVFSEMEKIYKQQHLTFIYMDRGGRDLREAGSFCTGK